MSDGGTLLRIEGLKKYFVEEESLLRRLHPGRGVKYVRAVDGVDLAVKEGETLGLVGESGCGKSTLARAALLLLEPTDGRVYYRGEEVTAYGDEELRGFRGEAQMIFQDPFASLNPRYTVRRALREPMRIHDIGDSKADRDRRAAELVERVGLGKEHLDRYPHEFSGGQRQRISIARALAVEPKLLVADEPTSALDVSVQAQILNLLEDLRDEMGLSMLFISHDLSVIRRISDRVAVMYLGGIVENAPTAKLFTEPAHPYTQALLSSIPVPDPTVTRQRIKLEGDVPTPIDPPSGCRFHPRCPKVIPPDGWSGGQSAWRRVLGFKTRVADGSINPDTVRDQLASRDGDGVDDAAVAGAILREHVTESDVAGRETVELPAEVRETVDDALDRLVAGDREGAAALLDGAFPTVCATDVPRVVETGADHTVVCHLYDDEQPGSPEPVGGSATLAGVESATGESGDG